MRLFRATLQRTDFVTHSIRTTLTVLFPVARRFLPLTQHENFSPVSQKLIDPEKPSQPPEKQIDAVKKNLEDACKNSGVSSREHITQLLQMTSILQRNNRYIAATEYLNKAATLNIKHDYLLQSTILHAQTVQYWHAQAWQQALETATANLSLLTQHTHTDHHTVIVPLHDIALTKFAMEKLSESADTFQKILSLPSVQQTIGWNPYTTCLGVTKLFLNNIPDAISILRRGLIQKYSPLNLLGRDRIGHAVTLNNLAICAAVQDDIKQAEEYLTMAGKYLEKVPALRAIVDINIDKLMKYPEHSLSPQFTI